VVRTVSVEAVFTDGSRLVVVDEPFGPVDRDPRAPGAVEAHEHPALPLADVVTVAVRNTSSVPISVTSHFHFFEVNPRLLFDRAVAYGRHLAIPAGSHVRIDAGDEVQVELVPVRGARVVIGFAGLVDGPLDAPGARQEALRRARACGFLDTAHDHPGNPGAAVPAVLDQLRGRAATVAP
jgi:urease subunit gamma/beta